MVTANQIANFRDYARVQQRGSWNMFSAEAQYATGLSQDEYRFVMENYSELKAAADLTD